MKSKQELTAPCGIGCFICEFYEENLTDDFAEMIHKKFGVPKEAISCKGCREQDGKHFHIPNGCATLDCVKAKGVELCCDCPDFPCKLLAPVADHASRYPHNIKVYNLSRIKNIGIERWAEEAADIKKRYFEHKFVIGKGQSD